MAKPKLSSLLVFGIEWGPSEGASKRTATDRLATQLLDRLQRRQLRATWALGDLTSPWVSRIRQATTAQEIALDATAITPPSGQQCFAFAAALRDHLRRAEEVGLGVRSLVLDPDGRVPYHTLAKLGFRAVRPGRGQAGRFAQLVQPQSLRYGLWGLPVSTRWPQSSRLLQRVVGHQWAYGLRRAAQHDAVVHIVFDLSCMAAQQQTALRDVDRLLDTAAALRDQQLLQIARLVDVDQLIRRETRARPMQSILRRAA